jgi:Caenorhabditis protein of unknown function, DUF268
MSKMDCFFSIEGRYRRLIENLAFVRGVASRAYVAPPTAVPAELTEAFTMGGTVPVLDWYFNSKPDPKSIGSIVVYKSTLIAQVRRDVAEGRYKSYGVTNDHLRDALRAFPINGKNVLIFGSVYPQYEAFCLNAGAYPVTIEYNVRCSDCDEIAFFTPAQFDALARKGEAAISISSFEHDGLGRYGDPVDPEGDLKAMRKLLTQIEPGGLAFVSVPIGRDALVWNAHRIYGPRRLPLLLRDWDVLACFGDGAGLASIDGSRLKLDTARWDTHYPLARSVQEWVFVLRTP